jgi:hypothetical protein
LASAHLQTNISDEMMMMREAVDLDVTHEVWPEGLIKNTKNLRISGAGQDSL